MLRPIGYLITTYPKSDVPKRFNAGSPFRIIAFFQNSRVREDIVQA